MILIWSKSGTFNINDSQNSRVLVIRKEFLRLVSLKKGTEGLKASGSWEALGHFLDFSGAQILTKQIEVNHKLQGQGIM